MYGGRGSDNWNLNYLNFKKKLLLDGVGGRGFEKITFLQITRKKFCDSQKIMIYYLRAMGFRNLKRIMNYINTSGGGAVDEFTELRNFETFP